MAKKSDVNLKRLREDMDRYLAFCRGQKKQVQRIVLTPTQYNAFVQETGTHKYNGVDLVPQ